VKSVEKTSLTKGLSSAGLREEPQNLLTIAGLLGEVPGDPAQVVVEFHAAGIKGAEVDEIHQAAVQVVDEGVRAGGIA
jgi:hypothetical protein